MILQHTLPDDDTPTVLRICGPLDENLRALERACGVKLSRRAAQLRIEGDDSAVHRAAALLVEISALSRSGDIPPERLAWLLRPASVPSARVEPGQSPQAGAAMAGSQADAQPVLHTRRADLQGRTATQVQYMRQIPVSLYTSPSPRD